jgi:hypothetical protein
MRLRTVALILSFLATSCLLEGTGVKKCTPAEAKHAESEVDLLKDWDQVYRSCKRFCQCDDGATAEGYSDVITRLLSDDWKSVKRLVTLSNRNKSFKNFVLKHIDESVSEDVLTRIATNARQSCPADGERLCVSIVKATGK